MLAEPRRKHRIGPNPRGKFFQEDEDNRGRQMLLKMGWKKGDGLGATCTGMSEPIKPKVNTESRGLGFDRKQDPWVAHNEEFEQLLKNLNSNSSDEDRQEKGEGVADEISGSTNHALEKKSKGSRSRIHYHKFVKNKDLSKASFKDMSCIFGKSLDVTVKLLSTNDVDSPESRDELKLNGESSEIVTEITDPAIVAESQEENKKRKKKKRKNKGQEDGSSSTPMEEESIQPDDVMEEAEDSENIKAERKKKKKKRKQKDPEEEPLTETIPDSDNDNKTEELQAESINEETAMDQDETEKEIKRKKKKSKKRKREAEDDEVQTISETATLVEPEPAPSSAENADPEEPETKKKKKKKSKKSRRDEDEVLEEVANVVPEDSVDSDLSAPAPPPQKEEEPNTDPIPPENAEKLGNMQFINRGSIVDYFRNKMLNRSKLLSQNIA